MDWSAGDGYDVTVASDEGTSLYIGACWTCFTAAIVFSQGKPYRKPFYTNSKWEVIKTPREKPVLFH